MLSKGRKSVQMGESMEESKGGGKERSWGS